MADLADELKRQRRNNGLLAGGTVVLVLLAIGSFLWLDKPGAPKVEDVPAPPKQTAPPLATPVADAPVPDPPQDTTPHQPADADATLRKVVGSWSTAPELAAWASEDGILQRVAAATNLTSRGASPKPVLAFVKIPGDFGVDEEIEKKPVVPGKPVDFTEKSFISATSFARYDRVTQIVTAIDPIAAGKGYATLRPYFDRVYGQIAAPGERFDSVLKGAITRLIAVPVPEGRVQVVPFGALYKYADTALEDRKPADKHLLRFGPKNQRAIQSWLRSFAVGAKIGAIE